MKFSTAITIARRNLQRTADSIIEKGAFTQTYSWEKKNYNEGKKTGDTMEMCKHL